MSQEAIIYTTLNGNTVAGDRIYPHTIPKDAPYPCISFQLINAIPENHIGDVPTLDKRRIQVRLISDDYEALKATVAIDGANGLAEEVRALLEPIGIMTLEIDAPFDLDTRAYSVIQDWVIYSQRN